jgi:energy-converting hydrogenase Eha subunit F
MRVVLLLLKGGIPMEKPGKTSVDIPRDVPLVPDITSKLIPSPTCSASAFSSLILQLPSTQWFIQG